MDRRRKYSLEQADFIKANAKGLPNQILTDLFNERFGTDIPMKKIKAFKKNHCLSSGLDGRFLKGSVPPNKGKKGVGGWEPTQFKKGNRPVNYKPVGSERIDTYGYVGVKVADPNVWQFKHRLLWEEHHGPVPIGHVVIFADSDKLNVTIENLLLVSRKQLAILNKRGLIQSDADLTRTGIIIADVIAKAHSLKKCRRSRIMEEAQ